MATQQTDKKEKKDRKPRTLNPLLAAKQAKERARKAVDKIAAELEEYNKAGQTLADDLAAAQSVLKKESEAYAALLTAEQESLV